ncbi:MAG: hypothetical protein WA790_19435, partial [Sulfitobacter sp.]
LFWDGVRRLPYSQADIIEGLCNLVGYGVALKGDIDNISGKHWEDASKALFGETLYVEFGADDESYSRSYVSVNAMRNAIRSDISDYVSQEFKSAQIVHPINVLRMASVPQQLFDTEPFFPLFLKEIVPMQVLMRDQALFFSPVRLTIFGLS